MIDAKTFATSYNAFWSANAPTCENFVRTLNAGEVDRFATPLGKNSAFSRAIIAELSFSAFAEIVRREYAKEKSTAWKTILGIAWKETVLRLRYFEFIEDDLDNELTKPEIDEIKELVRRLYAFFVKGSKERINIRPIFNGCGFVDQSEGDIVKGKILFEVKIVDRPFRGADIKQLITYAALNYASSQFEIDGLGLVNPLSGLYCVVNLKECCAGVSGLMPENLLPIIVDALSNGGISR